jgi:hypothetical protein
VAGIGDKGQGMREGTIECLKDNKAEVEDHPKSKRLPVIGRAVVVRVRHLHYLFLRVWWLAFVQPERETHSDDYTIIIEHLRI